MWARSKIMMLIGGVFFVIAAITSHEGAFLWGAWTWAFLGFAAWMFAAV
jgi:hypothetical protein